MRFKITNSPDREYAREIIEFTRKFTNGEDRAQYVRLVRLILTRDRHQQVISQLR